MKTSNYFYFELDNSSIYFEFVELWINCVRVNRARPVFQFEEFWIFRVLRIPTNL